MKGKILIAVSLVTALATAALARGPVLHQPPAPVPPSAYKEKKVDLSENELIIVGLIIQNRTALEKAAKVFAIQAAMISDLQERVEKLEADNKELHKL